MWQAYYSIISGGSSIGTEWAMQVLEGILDDDADMADMYLARRAQLTANNAASATQQRADFDNSPNAPPTSGMHAPPCAYQPCFCPSSSVPIIMWFSLLSG